MNNRSKPWWILGLFLPIVGFILFFIWNKKNHQNAVSVLIGSFIGLIIVLFSLIVILSPSKDISNSRSVDEWINDVETSSESVVTVFGASYCSHCQEYKPVITALANKYKFNLYFYEVDLLEESEYKKLLHTYEISDFEGSVTFTFIMKNKEYVAYTEGYAGEQVIIDFLKSNGIIEN